MEIPYRIFGTHLDDDGAVNEDSVGHVEADWENSIVQELQVAASRLYRHWSIPEKKHNVVFKPLHRRQLWNWPQWGVEAEVLNLAKKREQSVHLIPEIENLEVGDLQSILRSVNYEVYTGKWTLLYLVAWGAMLVTWITLEVVELSEGTSDWLPTGTSAISMVEPEFLNFYIWRI